VAVYVSDLDEDDEVDFKVKAKALPQKHFVGIGAILKHCNGVWIPWG